MVPFRLSWGFAGLVLILVMLSLTLGAEVGHTQQEAEMELFNSSLDDIEFMTTVDPVEYERYDRFESGLRTTYAIEQHNAVLLLNGSEDTQMQNNHPSIRWVNQLWDYLGWYFEVGVEHPDRADRVADILGIGLMLGFFIGFVATFRNGP